MRSNWHSASIPLDQQGKRINIALEYDPLEVYAPKAYSSIFLVRNVTVTPEDVALDIGTGTGVYAIGIALLGARHVVAVDTSEEALETARHNAALNGVADRIDFRHGSMFDPIEEGEKFSLIVSNPPCLPDPGDVKLTIPGTIMLSGTDGTHHASIFLEQAPRHLAPDGQILFVYPSTSNPGKIFGMLEQSYEHEIVAEIEIPFYLHFIELWEYLDHLRQQGVCDFHEKAGVPYRTYWLIRATPKR